MCGTFIIIMLTAVSLDGELKFRCIEIEDV